MRSSIACSRCRRSKIKCVNAGIDTTCRACESSGRECVYPPPATSTGGANSKRDLSSMIDGEERNGEFEVPKRVRPRKSNAANGAGGKDGHHKLHGHLGLALDPGILTVKVWETVLDLFQLHFSTMLPFLHPTTFLAQTRFAANPTGTLVHMDNQQAAGRHSQSPGPRNEASSLILLGVLTLTARFHPQLAEYHCPSTSRQPCNPLVASEFYAAALRSRLSGIDGRDLASPGIYRVQGLLMLGLHEWGMCRGGNAWIYVGMAIRLAQSMGLAFESETDRVLCRSPIDQKDQNSDDVIEQETKRRTFWSCFILDRCISGGKFRPRMIKVRDLGIQLPSDNAFAFGERVRTSRMVESSGNRKGLELNNKVVMPPPVPGMRPNGVGLVDDLKLRNGVNGPTMSDPKQWSSNASHRSEGNENGAIDRWEVGAEECVLSRLLRIFRIWGSIAKWSCAGGRRFDQYPPWHPESRFSRLKEMLLEFQDGLPRNLQYSPRNTETHIMYKNTLAPYSLMHIINFLSVIVLHRVYMQFLPLRAVDPQGPLDDPTFPPEMYQHAPDGLWKDMARETFRASRHMIELVKTCFDRAVLMETPLVGFAVYNAAIIGVYAAHFTNMDVEGSLSSRPTAPEIVPGLGGQGQAEVRKAIEILAGMRARLPMATGWFRTVNRMNRFYGRARQEYRQMLRNPEASENGKPFFPRDLSSFIANPDELRLLDKLFSDIGIPEDQAHDANGATEEISAPRTNGVHTTEGDAAKNHGSNESGDVAEVNGDHVPRRGDAWATVNGSPHQSTREDSTVLRPIDHERWGTLPGPQQTQPHSSPYSLPSIHQNLAATSAPLPTPPSSSSTLFSSTPTPACSSPPYPAPATRPQPLHPWPTSRQAPPAPPFSQSLPALNAAAQQSFPIPPLAAPFHPLPPSFPPFQHRSHLSPPRVLPSSTVVASSRLSPSESSLGAASMNSLCGDDVIAFVEGEAIDKWVATMGSSYTAIQKGWLGLVWENSAR